MFSKYLFIIFFSEIISEIIFKEQKHSLFLYIIHFLSKIIFENLKIFFKKYILIFKKIQKIKFQNYQPKQIL